MGKQILANSLARKCVKVIKAMDYEVDKIAIVASVSKKNKKVIEAKLDKVAKDVTTLYNRIKSKVAKANSVASIDENTSEVLKELAILATKVDLLKASMGEEELIMEDGEDEEEPISVDDVIKEFKEESGDGQEGLDENELEDNDEFGVEDESTPEKVTEDEAEGDEDIFDDEVEDDTEEGTEEDEVMIKDEPVTARRVNKVAQSKITARRKISKDIPSKPGSLGLFNFVKKGGSK